ncbi:MAG: hypothetical protein QOG25_3116 [Acetobacteraceae bacterium]|jgi:hypothetical protein|nr:hypothetical protein [Acetobacteraceae bacterium]
MLTRHKSEYRNEPPVQAGITPLPYKITALREAHQLRSLRDLDDAAILLRDMARLVFEEDALPLDHSPK